MMPNPREQTNESIAVNCIYSKMGKSSPNSEETVWS